MTLTKPQRRMLCSRKTGIGGDGMLFLENDPVYPFKMRYFNADGGEAALCGNGARCIALYAYNNGIATRTPFSFRSKSGIHDVSILGDDSVKISLPACVFHGSHRIVMKGKRLLYEIITVGVPHVVIFVDNTDRIDVRGIGKRIRNSERFRPHGTNVNFAAQTGKKSLSVRTYERGVEDETRACGTGVAASAAVALNKGMVSSPVRVKTASGETITVQFRYSGNTLVPYLIGRAHFVFAGAVTIP